MTKEDTTDKEEYLLSNHQEKKKFHALNESAPSSKLLYEWEQSTMEAEYIIKNLTLNQKVLDPMIRTTTLIQQH